MRVWDAITGTQKFCFKAPGHVQGVTFSPDDQFLAIGHHDGTTLWSLATDRVYKENSNPAKTVAYSADGRTLASAFHNNIELWDLDVEFLNQERLSKSVKIIEFSTDGKLVISSTGSAASAISVWNPFQESLQQVLNIQNRDTLRANVLALSADGQLLAYPSNPSSDPFRPVESIDVWDIKMSIHWSILMNARCSRMAFAPNSRQLATFGWDSISIWVYTRDFAQYPSLTKSNGNTPGVLQLGIEGDRCWVLERTLKRTKGEGRWGTVHSMSFSPDGRQLGVCRFDSRNCIYTVDIWDWTTGLLVQTLEPCLRILRSVVFSTNGQLLAREEWGDYENGKFRRVSGPIIEPWDLDTGKLHEALAGKARDELPQTAIIPSPPPVEGLEFLEFQTRYIKCQDITVLETEWVCFQGRKILWLPPKYRPTCSTAHDATHTLALGHERGRVTFIKFVKGTDFQI